MTNSPDSRVPGALSGVYLTDAELARRWRRSIRSVQRLRREGLAPPSMRVGRRRLSPIEGVEAVERRALLDEEGAE